MITYFFFGLSFAFACVIQPGPFQAYLFSQSVKNGWRSTVPLAFAPIISDLPGIILVIFILKNTPKEFTGILQCLGGIFLFYLAFKAYKAINTSNNNEDDHYSPYSSFFKAVIVNLLNPNPYLGWSLVMGPMLIKGWDKDPKNGIALITGFYGSMIAYSTVMIVLFAAAGKLGPGINRILLTFSVLAFTFFGFYQLWTGLMVFIRTGF
jgi:threonine/homoserine/homoserine lactone efflux protein